MCFFKKSLNNNKVLDIKINEKLLKFFFSNLDKMSQNQSISDKETMLRLINGENIILMDVKYPYHNGNYHFYYCECAKCRLCWFCSKYIKNKMGCLTHYGLRHPTYKFYWTNTLPKDIED